MEWNAVSVTKAILEISIIWFLIHRFLLFIRGTRVVPLVRGIAVLGALFILTKALDLVVLNWILTRLFAISVIGFLVIFQPEIRRGLSKIGQTYFFDVFSPAQEEGFVNKISQSMTSLAQKRIGALVAIERGVGLKTYAESGVRVEAVVTPELLNTIFSPLGPLHDGGVIIRGGRVAAAGCLFPLSHRQDLERDYGTRHRAALGLSEETDAVIVLVSEETGKIVLAQGGELIADFQGKDFTFMLKHLLLKEEKHKIFPPWRTKAKGAS